MDKKPFSIREAKPGDAALLADLGTRAFSQAFAGLNTPENMALYLAGAFSPRKQADELAMPGCTFFIIENEGIPAGYARLQAGSTKLCVTGAKPVELVRFYVLQQWVGKGIAGMLMEACLKSAKESGHDVIWLSSWTENPRAIAFYHKWSFKEVGGSTFILGEEIQEDVIMAREV
jgi:GNAT superfamily N-acetyltransferase